IFAKLAQALGLRSALDAGDEPDLWGRIDHMLASRGTSLAAVRAAPHGGRFEDGLEPGAFFAEHLQTPDGKVDCCPPAFAEALARAETIAGELAGRGAGRREGGRPPA